MTIAHIIIEIEEAEDNRDYWMRVTYSGGNDFDHPAAKAKFDQILKAVEKTLEE